MPSIALELFTDCTFATASNSVNTFVYSFLRTPDIVFNEEILAVRLISFAGSKPLSKNE